jgi:putative membrane protein insertion efficiency factor
MPKFLDTLKYWLRLTVIWLIKLYQKTLSPDHGFLRHLHPFGYCRFYPTCSQYGIEAIRKYGILKGGMMSAHRVIRCNPWNKGGYDPVK